MCPAAAADIRRTQVQLGRYNTSTITPCVLFYVCVEIGVVDWRGVYLMFPYAISEMRRRGGIYITAHLGAEVLWVTVAAQIRVDKSSLAALLNLLELQRCLWTSSSLWPWPSPAESMIPSRPSLRYSFSRDAIEGTNYLWKKLHICFMLVYVYFVLCLCRNWFCGWPEKGFIYNIHIYERF